MDKELLKKVMEVHNEPPTEVGEAVEKTLSTYLVDYIESKDFADEHTVNMLDGVKRAVGEETYSTYYDWISEKLKYVLSRTTHSILRNVDSFRYMDRTKKSDD